MVVPFLCDLAEYFIAPSFSELYNEVVILCAIAVHNKNATQFLNLYVLFYTTAISLI